MDYVNVLVKVPVGCTLEDMVMAINMARMTVAVSFEEVQKSKLLVVQDGVIYLNEEDYKASTA